MRNVPNWTQIQGVASPNASLIANAGDLFNKAVDDIRKPMDAAVANDTANLEAERSSTTQDFIARLSNATTPEELAAIQASSKGEFVDQKLINDAAREDISSLNTLASDQTIANNKLVNTNLQNRLKAADTFNLERIKNQNKEKAAQAAIYAERVKGYNSSPLNKPFEQTIEDWSKTMTAVDQDEIFNEDSWRGESGASLRRMGSNYAKNGLIIDHGNGQKETVRVTPEMYMSGIQFFKDNDQFLYDPGVAKNLMEAYVESVALEAQIGNLKRGAALFNKGTTPEARQKNKVTQEKYTKTRKAVTARFNALKLKAETAKIEKAKQAAEIDPATVPNEPDSWAGQIFKNILSPG